MSSNLSNFKIRGFKLKELVSIFIGPAPQGGMAPTKGVTFVSTEHDKGAWNGWDFQMADGGLLITPPWKGDCAFVPFSNVAFVQMRPTEVVETKKAVK